MIIKSKKVTVQTNAAPENRLTESSITTRQERKLKRQLIQNLKDDGKGHKHALYAKRLELYDFQIVSLKVDPDFTAAISFDEGKVYLSEGFLYEERAWEQLNVLMRHELAHNLMMHQIRMLYAVGRSDLINSVSFNRLMNYIEDDEISNRRYSSGDKDIVRKMTKAGQLIGGLVTEDHRPGWQNLSLEKMYNKIIEEVRALHLNILQLWSNIDQEKTAATETIKSDKDLIHGAIYNSGILAYAFPKEKSELTMPVKDFLKSPSFLQLSTKTRNFLNSIYDSYSYQTENYIKYTIERIAKSALRSPIDLGEYAVVTPEEKALAIDFLLAILGKLSDPPTEVYTGGGDGSNLTADYVNSWNEVMRDLDNSDVSDKDLQALLDEITG